MGRSGSCIRRFNILGWKIRGFFREMYKMKFYATYRYFTDPDYRKDINYMLNLVRQQEVVATTAEIGLNEIQSSHSINYHDWVEVLKNRVRTYGAGCLDPIKVFYDKSTGKYLIVDGNHRFSALISEVGPFYRVKVVLLVPKEEVRYDEQKSKY